MSLKLEIEDVWDTVQGILFISASLNYRSHHHHTFWYTGSIRVEISSLCYMKHLFPWNATVFFKKKKSQMNLNIILNLGYFFAGLLKRLNFANGQCGSLKPYFLSPPTLVNSVSQTPPHITGVWCVTLCLRNSTKFCGTQFGKLS